MLQRLCGEQTIDAQRNPVVVQQHAPIDGIVDPLHLFVGERVALFVAVVIVIVAAIAVLVAAGVVG